LVELMLALVISGVLISGLVQIASGARSSFRLQDNLAGMQENARYAFAVLRPAIMQAGFSPEPWRPEMQISALSPDTLDSVTARSDRLAVRYWSDLNCFENSNPVTDSSGIPLIFMKTSVFDLNDRMELTHTCRYGPDESNMKTQIRRHGLIQHVESFQLRYAEDSDGDNNADRWVRAGQWLDVRKVMGVQLGLLLRSPQAVVEAEQRTFSVLDVNLATPADGRLRRVFLLTTAIKGAIS
jgi:hypothetical protein